ncbi:hypothetical protein FQR65_LT16011 [Abscondita terminalis]|nr:hypothetical protein FQR65_LT16011 [Abscondita terminalis]
MDVQNEVEYIQEGTQTHNVIASTSQVSEDPETVRTPNELNNWRKYTPMQLQRPTTASLAVSEHNETKSNENKVLICLNSKKSRRRPTTTVKPLTSSDIASKYNLLLDKRLQLVDGQLKHMERENARVIEKLDLEIAILKIKLDKEKGC